MQTLFTIVLWTQTLGTTGSPWTNLERANCASASYAFSAVATNQSSRVLWANASEWAIDSESRLQDARFELDLSTFVGATLSLGRFSVDGVAANQTFPLPTGGAPLVLPWPFVPRDRIELRVDALPFRSGVALFSCLRFYAQFSNASSTTTGAAVVLPPAAPQEEDAAAGGGVDTFAEWALLGSFGLFFVGSLFVPPRGSGGTGAWVLKNRTPSAAGFFYAWLRHRGGEWVYVIGFERQAAGAGTLRGREFCPFLGARDGVHLYATGARDLLDARGAPLERRLAWLAAVSRATAAAHAECQSIGELSSLWVDPATQELALADYYCYAPGARAVAGDLGRLGQLAFELLPDCRSEEVVDLIERCLDTLNALTRPTAAECETVFEQCRRRLLISSPPSPSSGP
jgi:hypothetical protein